MRVQDKILPSGGEWERIVGSDPVIETIFPESGGALAAMDAAEGEDFLCAWPAGQEEPPGLSPCRLHNLRGRVRSEES